MKEPFLFKLTWPEVEEYLKEKGEKFVKAVVDEIVVFIEDLKRQ